MSTEQWKSMSVLGFSNYLCSESGKVMNVSNNNILKGTIKPNYISYSLKNDDAKTTTIGSHIIVSKLFTDYLVKLKELIDNHKWLPLTIYGLDRYQICEEGKFLSTKGKIMKTSFQNNAVKLSFEINSKSSTFRVCTLVATMFIPNPNNYKYVKFKDGNPRNINKNNLEWSDNTSKTEDPPDEVWEPLIGFPKYQINPKGIRNAKTHHILSQQLSSSGYPTITLFVNNYNKTVLVHKIMAIQYIPNPEPNTLIKVNHKNGIKTDFKIENLEWSTQSQNVQHAVDTGLRSKTTGNCRNIELLDENHNILYTFIDAKEAGKRVGCSREMIYYHMKSNKFQNGTIIINGYILRYKVEPDLEGEVWKNVNTLYVNINDKYKVSNYGRVKNIKNKILTPNLNHLGYGQVILSSYDEDIDDTIRKSILVHTLVAYAFLDFKGNREGYQVNHKDKNPRNNNLINLEILTTKEHMIKDQGRPVLCIKNDDEYYIFRSQGEAADLLGLNYSSVHYSITHKTNHGDYFWYHFDSEEAQDIMLKFQTQEINPTILYNPKSESIIKPNPKIKLIIIS